MLSKDDLIIGQLIAAGLPPDVVVKPSGIIAGLNEVSYSVSPYSSNFLDQVPEVTSELTPHSDVMELATTEMAKVVRGAFDMVKTYGVPMALAVADGVSCLYSIESVLRTVRSELDIKYINIDDPLFNLGIYPVQVANKSLSFESVNFDMLSRLKFNYVGNDELVEWIDSKHPEIVAVLNDKSSSNYDAISALNSFDELGRIFKAISNTQIDFSQTQSIDIPLLMKLFVITSKMYMSDKPVPWLAEGSLEDYREFVNLVWNGISRYLINLKEFIKLCRAREIMVVDIAPIRLKEITPSEALGVRVKVVEGKVLVYYTNAIMKTITESETAISDVVVASLYARVVGKNVSLKELANDKLRVAELMNEYVGTVSAVVNARSKTIFCESAALAIAKFIDSNPAAKAAMFAALGESGGMTATIVREKMNEAISKLFIIYNQRATGSEFGDVAVNDDSGVFVSERKKECVDIILSTDIVPVFLNLLGCNMAAAIIAATYVTQDKAFTAVDERAKLHCALIKVLAGVSLE